MLIDRGMDLVDLEGVTKGELAAFRDAYRTTHGSVLAAYEFWLEFDPVVVKSHRLQAHHSGSVEGRSLPLHGTLGFLHLYTVMAYEEGISYEVTHAKSLGASKREVLQTFEIAFMHSGPRGIDAASKAASEKLREWVREPEVVRSPFPADWKPDADLFQLDLDLEVGRLTPGERDSIHSWYQDTCGELPGFVRLLEGGRPGLLKAHHARMARAMRGPLPKQMLPFMQLQMHTAQANPRGIRESTLLGRGLGMTNDQLYEAVAWGMLYSGPSGLSVVLDAAGDVLLREDGQRTSERE